MRQVVQSGSSAQGLSQKKADDFSRFPGVQDWLMHTKHLDLLLLAGCSCLLTLLYHPVAEALPRAVAITSPAASALECCISPLKSDQ